MKHKIQICLSLLALVSASAFADYAYCPATLHCKVSAATASCASPDGWQVAYVSYSGQTPSEIDLSFFSAQSYPSTPSSGCNYYYAVSPADPLNNFYNIGIATSKWVTPVTKPTPGVWQPADTHFWCYSPYINPTTPPFSNDPQGCPFTLAQ